MVTTVDSKRKALSERQRDRRFRALAVTNKIAGKGMQVLHDGQLLVNFSSNDYLGLSSHPMILERASQWLNCYGAGCGASRLVTGNPLIFEVVEKKLARLKGTESALVMGPGFQTNLSLIAAVASEKSLVLCDRLSHNSLLNGAILSRARLIRFRHNDLADLERRISATSHTKFDSTWIISESVFSMDGDLADLEALAEAGRRHNANLLIDEAHATGVLGTLGMGATVGVPGIELVVGTFGKALGSYGSYVACSNLMRDYLINFAGGLIYSTALPPPVLGAIDAALDLVPNMDAERQRLVLMAEFVRREIKSLGFSCLNSSTQIIPVIAGTDEKALMMSDFLKQHGVLALPIRPPTVSQDSARIRLSLSAAHTDEEIEVLVSTFKKLSKVAL